MTIGKELNQQNQTHEESDPLLVKTSTPTFFLKQGLSCGNESAA